MSGSILYSYTYSRSRLLGMLGILIALPAMFLYLAMTNENYLVIQGFVELNVSQATAFYATFAVATGLVLVLGVRIALAATRGPLEVVLGDYTTVVPKASVSPGMIAIPYASITDQVLVRLPSAELMLSIKSSKGRASVLASNFESEERFAEFLEKLSERVKAA